jgi:uncharacterized RDD family membrane protein YckC
VAPDGRPLAEPGERILAYLIDYAILSLTTLVFTIPLLIYQFQVMGDWIETAQVRSGDPAAAPDPGELTDAMLDLFLPLLVAYLALFVLILVAFYVYRVELMFRTGQTLGKRIMGLRVVPAEPGASLTRGMAVRRWLVDSLGVVLVPMLVWVDGLWQYWDRPYRRCLHDMFAGTVVIKSGP